MNAMVPASNTMAELVERVIVNGDLSKLTASERLNYYRQVCESTGLNPLTKPFEYITLNGKMVLYALRGATDQLRAIHKVSVVESTESEREGVLIVTTKVQNADGRTDIARGAVSIANLKGEVLANAILKAETKAKRRATLSICGLGLLDETEIESIPNAVKGIPEPMPLPVFTPEPPPAPKASGQMTPQAWAQIACDRISTFNSTEEISAFVEKYQEKIDRLEESLPDMHHKLIGEIEDRRFVLSK